MMEGGLPALAGLGIALGLRHGVDWDHIAAIADITSASVPTASELGMPELEAAVYFGVATTAGTAPEIIAYYNAAINAALKVEAVRERLASMGYIAIGGTPEAYAQRLANETVRWRKVIKAANIPPPV